jgi:hypothetical protein
MTRNDLEDGKDDTPYKEAPEAFNANHVNGIYIIEIP